MRTEHTRQTRWSFAPEVVDPAVIPPGSIYVKQMIWAACTHCDLQVHALYAQLLTSGVKCPECGRVVAACDMLHGAESLRKVTAEEDRFRRRL